MPILIRPPLSLLALLAASSVSAGGLINDQQMLISHFGGQPVQSCESKVQPMLKQLLVPKLMALRPDSRTMVRCSAYIGVAPSAFMQAWKAQLGRLGYTSGSWSLNAGTYYLQSSAGNLTQGGRYATTESLYHPLSKDSGLMTMMGLESSGIRK